MMDKQHKSRIVIIGVGLIISSMLVRNIFHLISAQDRLKQAKIALQHEQQIQKELLERKNQINTQDFVETQARDKLGYVKPGETVVVLPDAQFLRSLVKSLPSEFSNSDKPNWQKWWDVFFEE